MPDTAIAECCFLFYCNFCTGLFSDVWENEFPSFCSYFLNAFVPFSKSFPIKSPTIIVPKAEEGWNNRCIHKREVLTLLQLLLYLNVLLMAWNSLYREIEKLFFNALVKWLLCFTFHTKQRERPFMMDFYDDDMSVFIKKENRRRLHF